MFLIDSKSFRYLFIFPSFIFKKCIWLKYNYRLWIGFYVHLSRPSTQATSLAWKNLPYHRRFPEIQPWSSDWILAQWLPKSCWWKITSTSSRYLKSRAGGWSSWKKGVNNLKNYLYDYDNDDDDDNLIIATELWISI